MSTLALPLVTSGADPPGQSTAPGHVIVLSDESCIHFNVNEPALPLAGGLENAKVTFPPDAVC